MGRDKLIKKINSEVNKLPYATDLTIFGVTDLWDPLGKRGVGDCEDFVLEKRARLKQAGVPLGDMRIALCTIAGGGMHAVLVVRGEEGDWILDNRNPVPATLDEFAGLGNRGVMIQMPSTPHFERWVT